MAETIGQHILCCNCPLEKKEKALDNYRKKVQRTIIKKKHSNDHLMIVNDQLYNHH